VKLIETRELRTGITAFIRRTWTRLTFGSLKYQERVVVSATGANFEDLLLMKRGKRDCDAKEGVVIRDLLTFSSGTCLTTTPLNR